MGQGTACTMCGGVHYSQKWMQICAYINGGETDVVAGFDEVEPRILADAHR